VVKLELWCKAKNREYYFMVLNMFKFLTVGIVLVQRGIGYDRHILANLLLRDIK